MLYGIRHIPTQKLLTISVSGNTNVDDDMAFGSYSAQLDLSGYGLVWYTSDKRTAEKVLSIGYNWYSSDLETPELPRCLADECEVVALNITAESLPPS